MTSGIRQVRTGMFHVLCCDCNAQHLTELVSQLTALPCADELTISTVTNPTELESAVNEQTDALVCDVLLGKYSGIHLIKGIKSRFPHIAIIFASNFLGYCEDIYAVEHIAFIRKPVTAEKLEMPIAKAMEQKRCTRGKYVLVKTKSITVTVPLNAILYVETVGRQVNVVTNDSFYPIPHRIEGILTYLDNRFAQYADGCYVNMDKISALQKKSITLFDGTVLPLEGCWYTAIRRAYISYLSEREASSARVKVLQLEA